MDKDGNVVGTRTGLTDKEARYKQSKNIGEFGRKLMYDARDEEDIKQDVKKSQLKQKVDDVRQLMADVDLEVSGLLNQRVGTEKFVLKPEDLRGEDKKRYEALQVKRKELKKDLLKSQQNFNNFILIQIKINYLVLKLKDQCFLGVHLLLKKLVFAS